MTTIATQLKNSHRTRLAAQAAREAAISAAYSRGQAPYLDPAVIAWETIIRDVSANHERILAGCESANR